MEKSRHGFDAVAERVAEIEHPPETAFLFVFFYHAGLEPDRPGRRLRKRSGDAFFLDEGKQLFVQGSGNLDDLGRSAGHLSLIERGQQLLIYDHAPGLMKGADDVLDPAQVDGRLAADGRVHLRQQGRRYIIKIYAPHIAGGHKAGQIAGHAAAQRQHAVAAVEAVLQHGCADLFKHGQILGGLAAPDRKNMHFAAGGGDVFDGGRRQLLVSYQHHLPVEIEDLSRPPDGAAFHDNIIAVLAELYRYDHFSFLPRA